MLYGLEHCPSVMLYGLFSLCATVSPVMRYGLDFRPLVMLYGLFRYALRSRPLCATVWKKKNSVLDSSKIESMCAQTNLLIFLKNMF